MWITKDMVGKRVTLYDRIVTIVSVGEELFLGREAHPATGEHDRERAWDLREDWELVPDAPKVKEMYPAIVYGSSGPFITSDLYCSKHDALNRLGTSYKIIWPAKVNSNGGYEVEEHE